MEFKFRIIDFVQLITYAVIFYIIGKFNPLLSVVGSFIIWGIGRFSIYIVTKNRR